MGLFGEVKCGRCDRRYSAIRNRCPYCGARKRRGSKSSGNDRAKGQVLVGFILLVVIVAAVAILLNKNLNAGKPKTSPTPTIQATSTPKQTSTPAPNATPTQTSSLPAVTPVPGQKVTSVALSRQDFTLSNIGETWVLTATVSPANASQVVNWSSEDTKVAKVDTDGRVTAVGPGATTITAEAGGVKTSCMVRVSGTASVSTGASSSSGGLSLNRTDITLNASANETFKLSVSGTSATPAFSGGSTGIATIDSSGTIKAVAPGTVSVYATVGETKLECIVRVIRK